MPLLRSDPSLTPYLIYDAPIDEKTKKIREQFKVDENTGYPEHYNWRNMAKLGPVYRPEDPFLKFEYPEGAEYGTDATIFASTGLLALLAYKIRSYTLRRPIWSKPHYFLGMWGLSFGLGYWGHQKTLERQGMKNAMIVDYVRKHPERFKDIERYKIRQLLFYYTPRR